jgi:NADPH-dependent 2,4-dienoyl-CoA reductase/sulfur reductase-like enzyme/peroxiredoxin family protein/rhodanese-related sulfurtransferase/TusA-related sulfurtransferase
LKIPNSEKQHKKTITVMKYIIVGGVAGGATVAARLRRNDENAEIILFERGEYVSYANCGLPYYIGEVINNRDNLFVQTVEGFKGRYNVDIRIRSEVEKVDAAGKSVEILDIESGRRYFETYDKLILSPGAEPLKPKIEGIESSRIFTLRNVPDTDKIKRFLTVKKVEKAVVVGGGFIGLEMAENLHEWGIKIDLVEMAPQVMAHLDFSMASIINSELTTKGVNLHLNDAVKKFEENPASITVELQSGKKLDADMVIWSIGVKPEIKLAKSAGIEIGLSGGIKVNEYMQSSNEHIYALGDATEVINVVTGKPALIPLAGPANKQGRIVADNIVYGNVSKYEGTIGTGIAKVFDLTVASTGANGKLLNSAGIKYISSFTHSSSHAGYYPNALPLSIKILFAPEDGRLLGAQVVGFDGVDKRIEMFAQVLKSKGTIYDLMNIEHAYAPPYSSAKDPVNMAGFVADNILKGRVKIVSWRKAAKSDPANDFLLDVRTKEEYSLGAIDNSVNIPLDELRGRLSEIPTDKRVIVYCAVGLRGYVASRILYQNGFENVFNLSGGYKTYSIATARQNATQFFAGQITSDDTLSEIDKETFIAVDATGLQCPGPIMQLKKSYDTLNVGERLEIRATDMAFGKDVASWCKITGAKLISVESRMGVITARVEKGEASSNCRISGGVVGDNKTIVVFSDNLDKALASFIIANGAASMGKKVTMFFTFWGLNVIKRKNPVKVKKDLMGKMFGMMLPKGASSLKLSQMNMFGLGSLMMRFVMRKKNIDTLEALIEQAQAAGVEFIACKMSMDVMGVQEEEIMDGVNFAGVATYLEKSEEANMSLFI